MPDLEPIVVSTLICHRDLETALTCLGSLVRHSAEPVEFFFHDDGSLTEEDRERLAAALPVHGVINRKDADQIVKPKLMDYPYCAQFRRRSVFGLKLFDAPLLAPGIDLAFCDTDLFFLRPFSGLFDWPDFRTGCVFMRDYQNAFAFRPWHLAFQDRFQMPSRLNCGLFNFRREYHDLELLEWLLARYHRVFAARPHWVEQTCWGALAMTCGGKFWSEKQLCVARAAASLPADPIGVHLVTPVRGLLPGLVERSCAGREREPILSEPMPRLGAIELGLEQVGRFARRKR